MNIGFICYPTYGGSGVVATELGLELAARGHEVHFISYAVPMRLDIFRPQRFLLQALQSPATCSDGQCRLPTVNGSHSFLP